MHLTFYTKQDKEYRDYYLQTHLKIIFKSHKKINIMKLHLLFAFFLFTFLSCEAQDNKTSKNINQLDLSFINNKKLKHSIALMACDTCAPMVDIMDIGYRVVVKLSEKDREVLKKIQPETWLNLLEGNSTDYASNLILYDIYDKDALRFNVCKDIKTWRKYFKKEDFDFWKAQFKK